MLCFRFNRDARRTEALSAGGELLGQQAARVRLSHAGQRDGAGGQDRLPSLQREKPQTNTEGERV